MKYFLLLLISVVVLFSCNEDEAEFPQVEDIIDQSDNELDFRSCWWCISEDLLGMLEGGGVGGAVAGPMGAAVGGAVVGAYRSVREYNAQNKISHADNSGYVDSLNTIYSLDRESNSFNSIGVLHNELLHKLILNRSNLNTSEEYYDFMINDLKSRERFNEFHFSDSFKNAIVTTMDRINSGERISIPNEHKNLYSELENSFKAADEVNLLEKISIAENSFEDDQVALQGIATAYHTWYFWKNLN